MPLKYEIKGGMPVGRDGRVHGIFRHTPSTLRSSMVSPNLQNIPRAADDSIQSLVKGMFVAPKGFIFVARDFSGIEAKLVGYHAGLKDYIRLAALGVHDFVNAHLVYSENKITAADLPDLSWSDADLSGYFKALKKRFPAERDIAKRVVHSGNYMVSPGHLSSVYPELFPKPKIAGNLLNFYYELFPGIRVWHETLCRQVDREPAVKNSFGHVHRFFQVLQWENLGGKWMWSYADDAKRLIAFKPQSDAALIGKRALKNCFYNYPETMAKWLRLFIHDEIFCECPIERADECDSILQFEMEKSIPEMRMNEDWGFGKYLSVGTEGKRGGSWDSMK